MQRDEGTWLSLLVKNLLVVVSRHVKGCCPSLMVNHSELWASHWVIYASKVLFKEFLLGPGLIVLQGQYNSRIRSRLLWLLPFVFDSPLIIYLIKITPLWRLLCSLIWKKTLVSHLALFHLQIAIWSPYEIAALTCSRLALHSVLLNK